MKVGQKVKAERERLGLTQEELAHRVGISQSSITAIENDRRSPNGPNRKKLANVLGVPESYLVNDTIEEVTRIARTVAPEVYRVYREAIDAGADPKKLDEELIDFITVRMKHLTRGK